VLYSCFVSRLLSVYHRRVADIRSRRRVRSTVTDDSSIWCSSDTTITVGEREFPVATTNSGANFPVTSLLLGCLLYFSSVYYYLLFIWWFIWWFIPDSTLLLCVFLLFISLTRPTRIALLSDLFQCAAVCTFNSTFIDWTTLSFILVLAPLIRRHTRFCARYTCFTLHSISRDFERWRPRLVLGWVTARCWPI